MAFLTPPPSSRKQRPIFMEPSSTLRYYEEIYGKRDEDEAIDANPDLCEDETDSDDNVDTPRRNTGVFKRAHQRYGWIKGPGKREATSSNNNKSNNASKSDNHQSKITPPSSPRQSIPLRQSKKLTLRKFGVFSTPISKMDSLNTAGEAMDDLFGTGIAGLGDLDYGALEGNDDDELIAMEPIEKQTFDTAMIDPALLSGAAQYLEQNSSPVALATESVPGHSEFEADVEDNISMINDMSEVPAVSNSQPEVVVAVKSFKPKANIAKTRTRAQDSSSGGRYSTRQQRMNKVKEDEGMSAKRQVTRAQDTKAKPTPAQIQAKNRNMMAARAAKAKKHGTKKAARKSTRGFRNWKGEAIEKSGYVSIGVAEADVDEYEKY